MLRTLSSLLAVRHGFRLPPRYSTSQALVDVEVEKKFFCNDAVILEVTKRASDFQHFEMMDTYFDTAAFDLTKRDLWLRLRNGTLELKWPQQYHESGALQSNQNIDFYNESTDRSTIVKAIRDHAAVQLFQTPDFAESLSAGGVRPFASLSTHRTRFHLTLPLPPQLGLPASQDVFVDVDKVWFLVVGAGEDQQDTHTQEVMFGEDPQTERPHYAIGEVEFCQSQGTQAQTLSAEQKVTAMHAVFAALVIDPQPVRGKVLEFIARYRPDHYAALRDAGQLASKGIH
ncbi:CYTH-like domain-containing protein [Ochromonadaceae sp. CCMP2298]|nr:CYTH-like domain-containing protein [Ochromonadaceae sp. CCMP2298]|mmetsp:Transcript_5746/g.12652  ORF Transcript_5746/g.12652 Transcript_5746/m.12652 type:complete len:286 (-) Transcript_5746:343-1200(-)